MPKCVTEAHKELMHYTTSSGLAGIVSSGCVWATNAVALNDSQEIIHFFDTRLIDIIREEVTNAINELIKNPRIAQRIESDGGSDKVAATQTEIVTNLLREGTLLFHQPHIFSLSAITNDRVRDNGLLSQWRGYGHDGGYALVFDSNEFEELLKSEVQQHFYQHMQWGDVYYYGLPDAEQRSNEEIVDAETKLRAGIRELHLDPKPSTMEESYDAMITLSCLFKHWGFHEEQEVRVVAIPPNQEVLSAAKDAGETRKPREISVISRGGLLVPYIELFKGGSGQSTKLPIKRVIVGPHPLSTTRKKTVEALLKSNGYDAEVKISEIPYLGR